MLPFTDQPVPCSFDPDLWDSRVASKAKEAAARCKNDCPILLRCLEHTQEVEGLLNQTLVGTRGGLTETQRRNTEFRRIA